MTINKKGEITDLVGEIVYVYDRQIFSTPERACAAYHEVDESNLTDDQANWCVENTNEIEEQTIDETHY